MSRRCGSRRRAVLGATFSGLASMALLQPLWADAQAESTRLVGGGTAQLAGEIVGWQNAIASADTPVDFAYFSRGSDEGRDQLLRGGWDFAVSGIPFSDDELARKPAGAGELIDVPISVASLSVLATTPVDGVGSWSTYRESVDQACVDELIAIGVDELEAIATCTTAVRGTFDGPFRIPPRNLASLLMGMTSEDHPERLSAWSNPGWVAAAGTDDLQIARQPRNRHTWVNRTEGSAANRSLLLYAKSMAPDVWQYATTSWLPDDPNNPFDYQWEPVKTQFPARSVSRFGSETQIGVMAIANQDVVTGNVHEGWSGNAGAIPTTIVADVLAQRPGAGFKVLEIQNANGDWVLPTQASIEASLAAGTEMNVAASQPVPGAYPLVWINRLYTFGGTLEPDQANALAASIRYIVTDGQAAVVDDGGAPLTPALVREALDAANQIVTTNCPAATHEVVTGGPTSFEALTPGVRALSGLRHCVVKTPASTSTSATTTSTIPPATTTTTVTTAATISAPQLSSSAPPSNTIGATPSFTPSVTQPRVASDPPVPEATESSIVDVSTTTTAVGEETTTTTAPGVEQGPRLARGLTNLPLGLPSDGTGGFKRLGSFVVGAAMFLGGRRLLAAQRMAT